MGDMDVFTKMAAKTENNLGIRHVDMLTGGGPETCQVGSVANTAALEKRGFGNIGSAHHSFKVVHGVFCRCTMGEHGNALSPVFFLYSLQLFSTGVKSFLPGNFLPFGCAPFAHVFHGVFQAIRIIEQLDSRVAACTDCLSVINGFRVSFEFHERAVSDFAH